MKKLETMTAEQLQNAPYSPVPFLVDELLPEGLHILAGAPKIGKSWLALWLCLCVAQGQALWNFATTQGEALYLSLEDSFQRIQTRLFDLTEDAPPTLHFSIMADTLKTRVGTADRAVSDRASSDQTRCDRHLAACPIYWRRQQSVRERLSGRRPAQAARRQTPHCDSLNSSSAEAPR